MPDCPGRRRQRHTGKALKLPESGPGHPYAVAAAPSSTGFTIERTSFSDLFTRVEIGQRPAPRATSAASGSATSASARPETAACG